MTKYFLITTLIFMQTLSMSQETPTLIYIGDPMCSWCYGFSPELSTVVEELGDKVELKMVMGGLRPYNKEKISGMKDFLKEHWEHVNEASGQPFDYGILDDPSFNYDTEPPSRAILVVRHLDPTAELPFFHDVQKLFYAENKHTDIAENYYPILEKYDIDKKAFTAAFHSEEMKLLTKADFEKAGDMGIKGFPSMVLLQDGKYKLIANGYQKSDQVVQTILKLLK